MVLVRRGGASDAGRSAVNFKETAPGDLSDVKCSIERQFLLLLLALCSRSGRTTLCQHLGQSVQPVPQAQLRCRHQKLRRRLVLWPYRTKILKKTDISKVQQIQELIFKSVVVFMYFQCISIISGLAPAPLDMEKLLLQARTLKKQAPEEEAEISKFQTINKLSS